MRLGKVSYKRALLVFGAVQTAWLLSSVDAWATTYTWAAPAAGNWNTDASWNPSTGTPSLQNDVADLSTQNITSTAAAPIAVSITSPVSVGSLKIGATTGTTAGYVLGTVTGSAFTFDSTSGAAVTKVGAGFADYIAAPVVLTGDLTIDNQAISSSYFQLGGGNTAATGGTGFATISGTGNILNNSTVGRFSITDRVTGDVGIVNNSTATLFYLNSGGGANTFTGGTTLNAGSIMSLGGPAANTNPLGTGPVNFNGAALYVATASKSLPNTINVAANTFNAVKGLTGSRTLTLAGPILGTGILSTGNTTLPGGFGITQLVGTTGSSQPNQSTTFFTGDISNFQGTFAHETIATAVAPATSVANGMNFEGTTAASMDGSQAKFSLSGLTSGTTLPFQFGSATAGLTFKMGDLSGPGGIIQQKAATDTLLEIGQLGLNSTWGGTINGTVNMTKVGAGTLTLTGPYSNDGTTTVSAGTLKVNGTTGGAGSFDVNNGGTLGGNGTISAGTVTVKSGGTIAPGASAGTLTVANLTFEDGSKTAFELTPTDVTVGSNINDLIDVQGALTAFAGTTLNIGVQSVNGSSLSTSVERTWTLGSYDFLFGSGVPTFNVTGAVGTPTVAIVPDFVGDPTGPGTIRLTLSATAGVPGDHNSDGHVNAADYVAWRKNPGGFAANAYDIWRQHFGNPPGSGSALGGANNVPEPGGILLFTLAAFTPLVLRKRRHDAHSRGA